MLVGVEAPLRCRGPICSLRVAVPFDLLMQSWDSGKRSNFQGRKEMTPYCRAKCWGVGKVSLTNLVLEMKPWCGTNLSRACVKDDSLAYHCYNKIFLSLSNCTEKWRYICLHPRPARAELMVMHWVRGGSVQRHPQFWFRFPAFLFCSPLLLENAHYSELGLILLGWKLRNAFNTCSPARVEA